jgi:hypothetical protein
MPLVRERHLPGVDYDNAPASSYCSVLEIALAFHVDEHFEHGVVHLLMWLSARVADRCRTGAIRVADHERR